eukprot:1158034-Pelagomonas_calceolata.AAC.1
MACLQKDGPKLCRAYVGPSVGVNGRLSPCNAHGRTASGLGLSASQGNICPPVHSAAYIYTCLVRSGGQRALPELDINHNACSFDYGVMT